MIRDTVAVTQAAMAEASKVVLGGLEVGTDVEIIEWPNRYADDRGRVMWERVMELLKGQQGQQGQQGQGGQQGREVGRGGTYLFPPCRPSILHIHNKLTSTLWGGREPNLTVTINDTTDLCRVCLQRPASLDGTRDTCRSARRGVHLCDAGPEHVAGQGICSWHPCRRVCGCGAGASAAMDQDAPGLPATGPGAKDNTRDNEAMTTTHDRIDPSPRRCKAHSSRTGEPCKLPPVKGSNVCRSHGGAAPQVKRKARQRIEEAADRMARELLKMATDDNVADSVKLAAIRDALDRAGLAARTAVSVEVGPPKPWEQIMYGLTEIESASRSEFRRSRGIADNSDQPPAAADPPASCEPWSVRKSRPRGTATKRPGVFAGIRPGDKKETS